MIQHQITLAQAIEYTKKYRENPEKNLPNSETFQAQSIRSLLNQEGCESFRIYYGKKENNTICSVLVGVDKNGNDILPTSSLEMRTEDDGIILEDAFQCPPVCPPPSPLNG
ncbi:hypothetical protein [Sediminibacterium goheungense]|uniref:Uncharacterized protein n=1 Tax=Sediminibacterium goheungense TaxID=1086393 RepID=A0A4R6IV93_9BACT|nr:hypothetical protein [Sediminibacterium goheungense]TDO26563.1 hypothetical protein BC659_1870 [Sediminibacterium goheungense]